MSQTELITDPSRFAEICSDETNVIESIEILTEEMIQVTFHKQGEFVEQMGHISPAIAAFTTASARLRLYEELEKLGDRVAYFDTGNFVHA